MQEEVMKSLLVVLGFLAFIMPIEADGKRSIRYSSGYGDEPPVYSVVSFGAVGDGITDDSNAFLEAWCHACTDPGAPTLLIPDGKTYLFGPTVFKGPCNSSMIVQIDGNIMAPDKMWNTLDMEHWLTFKHVDRLTLNGPGQIDGQGSVWWPCKESEQCDSAPNSVAIFHCTNLVLSGLKFLNSPGKHITIGQSVGVNVTGLTITAPETSPNTDGIHFQDCQNVLVTASTIGTGDDCISIGKGNSNLEISQIHCGPGHGISIGSLGKNDTEAIVERIHVSSCSFNQTQTGARIKTWQGGSGYVKDVIFENLQFSSVEKPIVIDQYYCNGKHNCGNKTSAVQVSNIMYDGLQGTSTNVSILLACSETVACRGILLRNIDIESAIPYVPTTSYCLNVYGLSAGQVTPHVPCLSQP